MVDLTEVITLGALLREETRGSHYRLDFPSATMETGSSILWSP